MIQKLNNQLIDSKRELARLNGKLEYANKSKKEFLANMSHDIRTPMNAIVGLSNLMMYDLDKPDKMRKYIDKLKTTSHHLLDMLSDVLDISKIEKGAYELRKQPVDILEQIRLVSELIRPQSQEKNQIFEVTAEKVRHHFVLGDDVRIRQVLINLLSNAVKYTQEGGKIRLEVIEKDIDGAGRAVYQITVEDNGMGMSEEFQSHIFEPFSRSDESVNKKIHGTGLGMAITKKFVDLMDGRISLESSLGQGSRFELTIPFVIDNKAEEQAQTREPDEIKEYSLNGKHFLCAEDNELNAEILSALLERSGAVCHICENGEELLYAFESADEGQYDAILTDIRMPVMDGYEAARRIRASGKSTAKKIPIIAMTANVFVEDIQKCLDSGIDAHIPKPIDIDTLSRELAKLV